MAHLAVAREADQVDGRMDLELLGARLLHLLVALALGEEHLVDVGEHTTGRDGHVAEQDVELLVVADGQLQVSGDDARALVVAGSVASELKDLSAQVLEHSREVDRGATAEAGSEVLLAHVASDTADRELESGAGRAALALGIGAAAALSLSLSFTLSGHDSKLEEVEKLFRN